MLKGVGIGSDGQKLFLYLAGQGKNDGKLLVSSSQDSKTFSQRQEALTLRPVTRHKITAGNFSNVKITTIGTEPTVTFIKTSKTGDHLYQASAKKYNYWSKARLIKGIHEPGVLLPIDKDRQVMFFGDISIHLATSARRDSWKIFSQPLLRPRDNYFDNSGLTAGQVRMTEQGILLTYYARYAYSDHQAITVGAALFDKQDPARLLWRSDHPLWQQPKNYRHLKIEIVGEVDFAGKSLLFLQCPDGQIFSVDLPLWGYLARSRPAGRRPHLERSHKNPILSPKAEHYWESKAVFNPAAFFAKGRVHLIYRAIGDDDVSTFGYASSRDGVHFDERLDRPVYEPRKHFEGRSIKRPSVPSAYTSGGSGIGGCEDPRVTLIGDILYMTYVAFDGYNPPRVALSTIPLEDFLSHRWNWTEPVLISPYIPGEGNKNCCIFPEKINGKYVIFHRIWPNILIDYADDLNFDGKHKFLTRAGHARIKPRKLHWDSRKIGVGASPIKTSSGWLMIYQAVGNQDTGKYKIGAMLLDLQNPTKVVARAQVPVLEPEAWYETEGWKYGVVYPCGAAVVNDELFVYYGGADTYTCVAKANLSDFIAHLLTHKPAVFDPVEL